MPSKLLPISKEEIQWVKKLTPRRGWTYHFSRGCLRNVMSIMTGLGPLDIPLKGDPGKPPSLAEIGAAAVAGLVGVSGVVSIDHVVEL